MAYEVVHFLDSDEILKGKEMKKEIKQLLDHVDQMLHGSFATSKQLKEALKERGWDAGGP